MPAFRILASALALFAVLALATAGDLPKSIEELLEAARAQSREGNYKEAAALWGEVVQRNPTFPAYWQARARSCYQAKSFAAAAEAYQKALELGHGYRWSMAYQIACCHARAGNKDLAIDWLGKAKSWGHRTFLSARTDDELASLRDDPRFQAFFPPENTAKLARNDGLRLDLKFYMDELARRHWDPYRRHAKAEFEAYAKKLHDEIPKLTDPQVEVRFMQLAAMAGDGHTHLRRDGKRLMLPLQCYQFDDGVFITAAAPAQKDLAGLEITEVAGKPIAEVLKALQPLISVDNPQGYKAAGPAFLIRPRFLFALGLIPSELEMTLTLKDAGGPTRNVTLAAGAAELDKTWITAHATATNPVPLYLKQRDKAYWFEHLPDQKLIFLQYNAVQNEGKESFSQFCTRLREFIDQNEVEKLVIDLRWNGGGNSFLNQPLIHAVIRSPKINERGKLFVIIGRQTFSAAQNCTTDLEMNTRCIFVGEPSGSSPNFIGESIRVTLPYSKMTGTFSDLYWGRSWPMDQRLWTPPEIYAPPQFSLYKDNRDPALEAIMAYRHKP